MSQQPLEYDLILSQPPSVPCSGGLFLVVWLKVGLCPLTVALVERQTVILEVPEGEKRGQKNIGKKCEQMTV